MDFLEIFTSGRCHKDMKVQKILASNSKRFGVYGIFKKLKNDDDKGELLNTTISEITSGIKNSPGYHF